MLPVTIAILALSAAGLAFAIIDLGIAAYGASTFGGTYDCGYNFATGTIETCKLSVPADISFLIFTSIWSILATPFTVIFPFLQSRKASVSHDALNTWLAPVLLSLYFVTLVFWLAAFADIANILGGFVSYAGSLTQAALAFAILNWLIYTTIFVLAILTACNVLEHDLPGFKPLFNQTGTTGNGFQMTQDHQTAHAEPKNDAVPEMVA